MLYYLYKSNILKKVFNFCNNVFELFLLWHLPSTKEWSNGKRLKYTTHIVNMFILSIFDINSRSCESILKDIVNDMPKCIDNILKYETYTWRTLYYVASIRGQTCINLQINGTNILLYLKKYKKFVLHRYKCMKKYPHIFP